MATISSIALASSLIAAASVSLPPPEGGLDGLLDRLRGRPALIELPALADLGDPLALPAGWGYLQADADSIAALQARFSVTEIPALLLLDRFGNVLHRELGNGARNRLGAALREFSRRRRELGGRLRRLEEQAEQARRRGDGAAELRRLNALRALGVRGYPEVVRAAERRHALDRERRTELLRLLAGEGIRSQSELQEGLRRLLQSSEGLPIAAEIERLLQQLRAGLIVRQTAGD